MVIGSFKAPSASFGIWKWGGLPPVYLARLALSLDLVL